MPDEPRHFDVDQLLEPLDDPVDQWLDWEQQANLIGFRASTRPVRVELVSIPREGLEVHVLPGACAELVERFVRGERVLFPRHPLNRDPGVAWFDAPAAKSWWGRFTSSRTLAFSGHESGPGLFSLKLATDHPHPDCHQPEKTRLREEAVGAIEWAERLARIDRCLGPMPDVHLIVEVLVVLVAGGESGVLLRDLRLFQDGHHYLPALSLPWVGRQIAARHGERFERFWGRHFAEAVGRAKAQLLVRYGLWYETPNPQNVVIQLRPDLYPTGRLVFRDVGDGYCATDAKACKDVPWTRLTDDIRPETRNSFWAFDACGSHAVGPAVLDAWYALHDRAYFGELARWFPELEPPPALPAEAWLEHWNRALRSEAGVATVARAFDPECRDAREHEL